MLGNEEYEQNAGIFRFSVLGSHHLQYLVLITEEGISIINDYETENILRVFLDFITSSNERFKESEKVEMLKNVSHVLKSRMDLIERSSISEDVEY